jgi:hypothetical protein
MERLRAMSANLTRCKLKAINLPLSGFSFERKAAGKATVIWLKAEYHNVRGRGNRWSELAPGSSVMPLVLSSLQGS